ncbi:MAG TPA: energy transducer TonB [Longimicrobiales bacterium]|nr:energy transducer TonB [Longimicrobiales bacterium]
MAKEEMTATATTANDQFKAGFGNWFWGSMIAATMVHFAIFAFFPTLSAEDVSFTPDEMAAIDIPPEVEIPPPPEAISRPATPVISEAEIDEDITIATTTFEDNPIENLPPPPTASGGQDLSAAPVFTPMTVRPRVLNTREVEQALTRNYPAILRDAGIGGTVEVWFFVDETGKVINRQLNKSSGYDQLDQAALNVAQVIRVSPAENRGDKVPVWVSIPITFHSK